MGEKKSGSHNCGKPYVTPVAYRNHKFQQKPVGGSGTSGGEVYASVRCFKCGVLGHHDVECKRTCMTCFKCGK